MSDTLVTYFSHAGQNYVSGNIEVLERGNAQILAEFAAKITGADLFEIKRSVPYPTDYRACVSEASKEMKLSARPTLERDCDVTSYARIILVFPNWCGTMPMPIYTWLEAHDFTGKSICPICTHEGSGLSNTERDIATACPGATVNRGLAVKGSAAADSEVEVRDWIANL